MAEVEGGARPVLHERYPTSSLVTYNGVTALHFALGGWGIALGWGYTDHAYFAAVVYMVFAFVQMFLIMPLIVCPNCVYYKMDGGRCVSGMNLVSRRIAKEGSSDDFPKRAGRPLSHNKLYMGSLFIPLLAIGPTLLFNFSYGLLGIFLAVLGLLLFRFFVVFTKVACVHCMAKRHCPNAQAMDLV